MSVLKYKRHKLQQDQETVTLFIDMRDASHVRQLRAVEVLEPDLNPTLTSVYIGQCTVSWDEFQEDLAPLSHKNC